MDLLLQTSTSGLTNLWKKSLLEETGNGSAIKNMIGKTLGKEELFLDPSRWLSMMFVMKILLFLQNSLGKRSTFPLRLHLFLLETEEPDHLV